MTDGGTAKRLLREQVAEEVRALLARKRMTGADIAEAIERSPMYVSRRVRGEVAFDLDDIQKIAKVLDVEIGALFPREGGSSRDFDLAPADAAMTVGHSFVDLAKGVTVVTKPRKTPPPSGRPKPGHSRPVSAVPARKRRPVPVRPGERPTAK